MENEKKKNIFAAYFEDFGLRQICDILMLTGAILLIVGLSICRVALPASKIILAVGLCVYIVASALAVTRAVLVLVSKMNRRAPEYKRAIVNTVIMSVIFVLAVVALVLLFVL